MINDVIINESLNNIMNPKFATSLLSTLTTWAANDACAPAHYVCAVSVRRMGASKLCMCGLC